MMHDFRCYSCMRCTRCNMGMGELLSMENPPTCASLPAVRHPHPIRLASAGDSDYVPEWAVPLAPPRPSKQTAA